MSKETREFGNKEQTARKELENFIRRANRSKTLENSRETREIENTEQTGRKRLEN